MACGKTGSLRLRFCRYCVALVVIKIKFVIFIQKIINKFENKGAKNTRNYVKLGKCLYKYVNRSIIYLSRSKNKCNYVFRHLEQTQMTSVNIAHIA